MKQLWKIVSRRRGEEDEEDFAYVTKVLRHTYLKAPEGNLIGIRRRQGFLRKDDDEII